MNTKRLAILGAGFSGLTLARSLQKRGFEVEIFESRPRAGGLIQTTNQKILVESAAHALLATAEVEKLFAELDIKMLKAGHISNAKWLFRGRPRKWPLSIGETLSSLGIPKKPKPSETVAEWLRRNFSDSMNDFIVAPVLQGIYGAQTDQLSASLVLGAFFDKSLRPKKGRTKGSVVPLNGMGELIEKLSQNVKINFEKTIGIKSAISKEGHSKVGLSNEVDSNGFDSLESLHRHFAAVVIATDISSAAKLLQPLLPELAQQMQEVPKVSLCSATISFDGDSRRIQGFGCLFPKSENFESLGVLFNSDIFFNRGKNNETWIFAGDQSETSDAALLEKIKKDRRNINPTKSKKKIGSKIKTNDAGASGEISAHEVDVNFCEIHRWPNVLPLYGLELEKMLNSKPLAECFKNGAKVSENIYLTGNYLGGIGLSKILDYNERLAQKIEMDLK